MANRAYLFSSECNPDESLTWLDLDRNEQRYYDSRHNIPLAWFFFFQPADVKLVDRFSAQGYLKDVRYWQQPKLMAHKRRAFDTFGANQPLLSQIVGPGLNTASFERFIPTLQSMTGDCLCLDPREIAQDDEDDFLPLRRIVELIDDKITSLETLKAALGSFSRVAYKDEDDLVLNVLGYTYGDFTPGTFGERLSP